MTAPMFMIQPPIVRSRFADWPLAVKSILGFWFFYALTVVVRAFLGSDPWAMLQNKLFIIGIGMVINGIIYVAIGALSDGKSIRRKALIAGLGCVIGSIALGGTVVSLEDMMRESKEEMRFQARE